MYEYEIIYNGTNEHDFLYGYSFADACRRRKIDPNTVTVFGAWYIDYGG